MMDAKEHITTLCALGTLGAAATGFAFAIEEPLLHLTRPGKRKWAGSSAQSWSLTTVDPALPRRSVSQPHTPTLTALPPFSAPPNHSRTLLSSTTRRNISGWDDLSQDIPSSRGSSTSRRSILRPKTAQSKSNAEKRESSTSSNWLKRLSSLSSNSSSYASSLRAQEVDPVANIPPIPPRSVSGAPTVPNKLVKRSVSHRGLSHEEAKGQMFRRPATSRQRSQTFKEILARPQSRGLELPESMIDSSESSLPSTSAGQQPVWRAYFESGFPRKRRKSESVIDSSQIRTVRLGAYSQPTMVLGHNMYGQEISQISSEPEPIGLLGASTVTEPRRSRYSLTSMRKNSRRRNLTDPSVQLTRAFVNGTFSSANSRETGLVASGASPPNAVLIFDEATFNSSPPPLSYNHSSGHPNSTTISDPFTASSDADIHMFSDEESLNFPSDTAYDSIATRTTVSSHRGQHESKLETIFAARTSDEVAASSELWHSFRPEDTSTSNTSRSPQQHSNHQPISLDDVPLDSDTDVIPQIRNHLASTPPRAVSPAAESFNLTPIPLNPHRAELYSSSPLLPGRSDAKVYSDVGEMLEDMRLDEEDEIDWSPQGKASSNVGVDAANSVASTKNETTHPLITRFREPEIHKIQVNGKQLKPSIFDWSEHQQINGFSRPKTVHGKQTNGDRSRSSGRKGPPQLHFRSQSVPVNRDGPSEEIQIPSKYPTWRLGHTQVSEEWSDDFEFEDVIEGLKTPNVPTTNDHSNPRDSIRSVKIPQSIIDRQSSVHLQFGQVQEFMALVEGLKELRSRGGELQLLNGSCKHLWEEAEAIVNLATINDDEPEPISAPSPTSSDPFADFAPQPNRSRSNTSSTARGRRLTATNKRSASNISSVAPQGRTRGESLAQARHLLQNMHQNRTAPDSSPREIEIHQQKKLQFDTQDLKDLVDRSTVVTRALKEEVRRTEGVSISPQKTPPTTRGNYLSEMFRAPEPQNVSPCPPFRKPGLLKSHSANSYLENSDTRHYTGPFDPPLALTTIVQPQFSTPTTSSILT